MGEAWRSDGGIPVRLSITDLSIAAHEGRRGPDPSQASSPTLEKGGRCKKSHYERQHLRPFGDSRSPQAHRRIPTIMIMMMIKPAAAAAAAALNGFLAHSSPHPLRLGSLSLSLSPHNPHLVGFSGRQPARTAGKRPSRLVPLALFPPQRPVAEGETLLASTPPPNPAHPSGARARPRRRSLTGSARRRTLQRRDGFSVSRGASL